MSTDLSTHRQPLTPSSLKAYLQARGTAPFADLVNRFDAPPEAVSAILTFWQDRGRVRAVPLDSNAACTSGCSDCGPGGREAHCAVPDDQPRQYDLYTWIDPEAMPLDLDALAIHQQTHG